MYLIDGIDLKAILQSLRDNILAIDEGQTSSARQMYTARAILNVKEIEGAIIATEPDVDHER
jgi:hypothetical protein